MKFTRVISLLLVIAMITVAFASCKIWGPDDQTTEPTTTTTTTVVEKTDKYDTITVAEAIEIAKAETSKDPTTRYYIRAKIVSISNPAYGEMTIADETGEIYVYGVYSADGSIGYANFEDKPVKGDEVLLHCTLNTYNDKPQVKNARLIEFTPASKDDIDASDYTEMTVADAREAALGTKISVTGIVARITYANGMKPSGVYLVDGTNSIYVYDGDIAGQVSIGNKITVLGEKDYWILADEANNASKHGYKGCCQLSSATLYENDKATNEIDFSWCEEKTVKEILNIPVTENITTTTYKTTALVKKVPGSSFVNYYFFDLDGETGEYTYTQCNGSDFAWLDEFDGKICTVYLSPMNAKSTSSDCIFRFLPVAVVDEGYTFDLANTPEFVIEYHAVDQFLPVYTGNPSKELPSSISSDLLGFYNATISYVSDNESSVYFTVDTPGTVTLNCGENGVANVTITATYGEYTASKTITITVDAPVASEGLTVEEAVNATLGETIKVEGIVGPSLVNRDGFYLIDDTGVIAVVVNDPNVWVGLAIGQKVVIEGKRDLFHNNQGTHAGQIAITNATIVANYYGNHEYSTESFITGKTLTDFYALDVTENHSNEVYILNATVYVQETQYYTNLKLKYQYTEGTTTKTTEVSLYCSSASQYNWLKAYAGQEVTIEIAPCNWNNKTYWTGCVLAVYTDDGKVCNELNFK